MSYRAYWLRTMSDETRSTETAWAQRELTEGHHGEIVERVAGYEDEALLSDLLRLPDRSSRHRRHVAEAVFRRALVLAERDGVHWTLLLDDLSHRASALGLDAAPTRRVMTRHIEALVRSTTDPLPALTAEHFQQFRSPAFLQHFSDALRADQLPLERFREVADTLDADRLWNNATLTDAQRDWMVERAVEDLTTPTQSRHDGVRLIQAMARAPFLPPTEQQARRLLEALLAQFVTADTMLEERTGRVLVPSTLTLQSFARIPSLGPEALDLLIAGVRRGGRHAIPDVLLGPLVAHGAMDAERAHTLLPASLEAQAHEALMGRPDLVTDSRIGARLEGRRDGATLRLRAQMAGPAEFPALFQRLVSTAPTAALSLISERSPHPIDPAWLAPLLSHRSMRIRQETVFALGRLEGGRSPVTDVETTRRPPRGGS